VQLGGDGSSMLARLGARGLMKRVASGARWPGAALACLLGVAAVCSASEASAAPPQRSAKVAARAVPRRASKAVGVAPSGRTPAVTAAAGAAQPGSAPAVPAPAAAATPAAPGAPPGAVAADGRATVVKTEEQHAGERTYTFGAQEVEGRLKSPQILYFLRRVRAEFDPAPLGHRSFLLELYDTRRHPALE